MDTVGPECDMSSVSWSTALDETGNWPARQIPWTASLRHSSSFVGETTQISFNKLVRGRVSYTKIKIRLGGDILTAAVRYLRRPNTNQNMYEARSDHDLLLCLLCRPVVHRT